MIELITIALQGLTLLFAPFVFWAAIREIRIELRRKQ